ncbi:hypothetical protein HPP92_006344 [Vanilla planifolia]|uniref:DUF4378 domain-containing protein n=1 Tax=Vanilla planifolia TaxID=51239 RepID=A0A835RI57_VANPL|nr:hypothetical protein HPP92_006344 [Vanilla planifolia]
MAELLRLDSCRLFGNQHPGCIWGLRHLFDFHQRREDREIAAYRRMDDSRYGTDISGNDESGDEDSVSYTGATIVMESTAKTKTKNSGKGILNFIGNKLSKKQKRIEKMSDSSSRPMHATSIHHSEDEYVLTGDSSPMTLRSETSNIALNFNKNDSLAVDEHVSQVTGRESMALDRVDDINGKPNNFDKEGQSLFDEHVVLKEKLIEARDALLKQNDLDPKGVTKEFAFRSKIFLDTLQLYNNNREAIYSKCKEQNSFLMNDVSVLKEPSDSRALQESLPFFGPYLMDNAASIAMPNHKQIQNDILVNQGPKLQSEEALIISEVLPSSLEFRKQGTKTVLRRLRDLKKRIKYAIKENKKERNRISKDGILHKVPVGKKLLEAKKEEKQNLGGGFVSEKFYKGGQASKFNSATPNTCDRKVAHNSIQRSHSLTESLGRYSHLLDSISVNERHKVPVRSFSIREGTLLHGNLPKTQGRMFSSPEFKLLSLSKYVQKEVELAFHSSKNPVLEPPKEPSSDLSGTVNMVEEIDIEQEGAMDSISVANTNQHYLLSDKLLSITEEAGLSPTKRQEVHCGSGNGPFDISDVMEDKSSLLDKHDNEIEDEPAVKPEKSSPISVLDSYMEEEPISPVKFIVSEVPQFQLFQDALEQPLPFGAHNHLDNNEPNVDESFKPIFNYVKYMLSKHGYDLLLCETDFTSHGKCVAAGQTLEEMPFEEQLIFDLMNEVLVGVFEHSTAPSCWLPRFHPKIRSTPTGSRLLKEVWAEIEWHLYPSFDNVVGRQLSKDDGWMNLYRDAECFGLLLEEMMLDDLLEEVLVESNEF